MSQAAPSVVPAIINVSNACTLERCLRLVAGLTLLGSIINASSAFFPIVFNRAADATDFLILALGFLLLYGFLRIFTRRFTSPFLLVPALVLVVLVYATCIVYVMMKIWIKALYLWFLVLVLLFTALLAIAAIKQGALRIYRAMTNYKRRWGRNGPYMKFVLSRGLMHPLGLLYFGGVVGSILLIPVAHVFVRDRPDLAAWALIAAAWWCYRQGGRLSIAKEISSENELPPGFTFYLRSFLDDATEVGSPGEIEFESLLGPSRLEEIAVAAVWPFDPVLCLGHQSSPPLG